MATQIVYVRGKVPVPELVDQLAGDQSFIEDARAALELDEGTFDALIGALETSDSFLAADALELVVNESLGKGESATKIFGLFKNLSRLLRGASAPIEQTAAKLRGAIKKRAEQVPEDQRERLGERLEKLLLAPSGVRRLWKAERLSKSTGIEVEDIQFLCDIRPVFDDSRSSIEGAIPISTLKFDVIETDGTPRRVEIRLTERQLGELISKAELARQKIRAIKQTLLDKSIPLPIIPGTND